MVTIKEKEAYKLALFDSVLNALVERNPHLNLDAGSITEFPKKRLQKGTHYTGFARTIENTTEQL
ncbi:MAG: hypothetical protein HXS46_00440 [Theionarchaea archaeon]|nr:hypothetical protein [Theionarchaea archaeon]